MAGREDPSSTAHFVAAAKLLSVPPPARPFVRLPVCLKFSPSHLAKVAAMNIVIASEFDGCFWLSFPRNFDFQEMGYKAP